MEVTRKNFREVLTDLERLIPSAEFLAIDGEFTGLNAGQDVNAFDTPAQYYSKLRSGAMDFLLVQFGLCIFNYDRELDKYTHRAYNFYIFPRPQNRSVPDPRFLCQSSSIDFLSSMGFDFNKLFKEGIPYLTQPDEQRLRESLEEKQKSRSSMKNSSPADGEDNPPIPIPEEYVSTIEDVCSRIEKFMNSTEPKELELDRCNGFMRKLIFQEVALRFDSDKIFLESRVLENKQRVLVVARTGSDEEKKQREKEKQEKELQELEDAVGFTVVLKKISESGKLVIGHNMLLDVCHLIHQCYFPLPASYSEFKELTLCAFPKLVDTKYMSSSSVFKETITSSVLEHLFKSLSEKPFKMYTAEPEEEGCGYHSITEKYHEAGYDAFITGLCFIAMSNHIGSLQKPKKYPVLSSSPLLEPFINKLFLMRIQDSPYINLAGEDPLVSRSHVFYVSCPKEWKNSDLMQLFSPFGSVFIAWINDSSAFVALNKRNLASLVKKTLSQSDSCTVMTYAAYQKLQNPRTKCRCAFSGGKSLCAECIAGRQTFPASPSASMRKRQSKEATQEEQTAPSKRRRSSSFGDKTSYSNRSIEPIPEEQESDEEEVLDEEESSESQNSTGGSKSGSSGAAASPGSSSVKNQKKIFAESDCWE